MISKYLTEIKRGEKWHPTTIWWDYPNVHAVINALLTWAERRGVNLNSVRVKRLRTKDELLKAESDILWCNE